MVIFSQIGGESRRKGLFCPFPGVAKEVVFLKTEYHDGGKCMSVYKLLLFILFATAVGCETNVGEDIKGEGRLLEEVFLWVSSTRTNGDFGGPEGADRICEEDATGRLSTSGVTHRAVLRGVFTRPVTGSLIISDGDPPAKRLDGTIIVEEFSDFLLDDPALVPVEDGAAKEYWTGASDAGLDGACDDWTSDDSSLEAEKGISNTTGFDRYEGGRASCDQQLHILCSSF